MSPCRTLQWRSPARSSRARASDSMSSDMSRPRPRSIEGPNSSSIRPVPVPRSSSERTSVPARAARIASSTACIGDVQLADAVPLGGVAGEIGLRRRGARRTNRGEPLAVAQQHRRRPNRAGRSGRARVPPHRRCSPSRKNAHEPSRNRSTSPASASSRRCREMRGCDWRKMSVSSETVSSASPSSARMRRRVASPAALSAPLSSPNGRWAEPAIGGQHSSKGAPRIGT